MIAVDLSGSMRIEDMQRGSLIETRMETVRRVVTDFVERRRGDRLGLILFGTQSYLQAPLTFDVDTVARFMNEAQIGFAGPETAIGDAIGLAVKQLRERPAESRVLVLLTDGQDNASAVPPLSAADIAASFGIRIHTIGVGSDQLRVAGLFGTRTVDPSADLDETTLQGIAQRTGGRYFRARDPAELEEIYALLDTLEPMEQDAGSVRPRRALSHWPLAAGVLLWLGLALRELWRRQRRRAIA
jgi:Ca-activated chloride channel family protein